MRLAEKVIELEERIEELELNYESLWTRMSLGAMFMIKDFNKDTVRKTAQEILQEIGEEEPDMEQTTGEL